MSSCAKFYCVVLVLILNGLLSNGKYVQGTGIRRREETRTKEELLAYYYDLDSWNNDPRANHRESHEITDLKIVLPNNIKNLLFGNIERELFKRNPEKETESSLYNIFMTYAAMLFGTNEPAPLVNGL